MSPLLGGPGGSGIDLITGITGEQLRKDFRGNYDLVSWDPRGVGFYTL